MAFENMDDIDPGVEEAGPPPEESSNKPFLIVAGILGGVMLLSLLCLAAFAFMRFPEMQAARKATQAEAVFLSTEAAVSVKQTSDAKAVKPTLTATASPTATVVPPTPTLVVAMAATRTPSPTPAEPDPRTATVAALLTQAVEAQTSVPAVTVTELPQSGLADEVGVPGMLGLAALMVGMIFVARRMRLAS